MSAWFFDEANGWTLEQRQAIQFTGVAHTPRPNTTITVSATGVFFVQGSDSNIYQVNAQTVAGGGSRIDIEGDHSVLIPATGTVGVAPGDIAYFVDGTNNRAFFNASLVEVNVSRTDQTGLVDISAGAAVVDQTYDATSANAQSGLAVADAIEDFVTETEQTAAITSATSDFVTETEQTAAINTATSGLATTAAQTAAIAAAIAAIDLDGVDLTLLQGAEDTSTTPSTFGPDVYPAAAAFIAAGLPESSVTGDYDLTVGTRIATFGSLVANYEVITAVAVTPGSEFTLNPSDFVKIAPTGTPVASWDTVVEDKDIEDFVEEDFVTTAVSNSHFSLSISESVDFLQPSTAAGTQVNLQAAVEQIHTSGMEFAPGGATGTIRFTDLLTAQDLTEHRPFPAQVSPATAASRLYAALNIPNTPLLVILELQHSLFLDSNGDNNVAINTDYDVAAILVYANGSPIATSLNVGNANFTLGTDGYIQETFEIYELTRVSFDVATLGTTKQDNLTAGTGVTIDGNNIISSSGISLGSGDNIGVDATFKGNHGTSATDIEIVPFGPADATVADNITAANAWLNAVLYAPDATPAQLAAGVATTAPGLLHRGNSRVEIPVGTTITVSPLAGHITIDIAGAASTFPSSSTDFNYHLTSEETEFAGGNAHVSITGDGVVWSHDGDQYNVDIAHNEGITVGSGIAGLASIELNGVHSEVSDHLVVNPTDNSTGTGITALNNWLVETLFFSSAAFVVDVERFTERAATLTRGTESIVIPASTGITLTSTVRARFAIADSNATFPNQASVAADYTLATNEEFVVDGTSHLEIPGSWFREGIESFELRTYTYSIDDVISFNARFVGNSDVPESITTTAGTERSVAGVVSHRLRAFNNPNSTFDSTANTLSVPRTSFSSSFTEHVETANSHYAMVVEDNLKWYLYTGPIPASGNIVYNVISVVSDTLDQQGILEEVILGPDLERAAGYVLLEEQVSKTNALTDAERLKLNSFNTSLVGTTVLANIITATNNSTATGSERRLRAPNATFYDWVYFPLSLPQDDQFRGLIEAVLPSNAINVGQSVSLKGDPDAIVTVKEKFVINTNGTTNASGNSLYRFYTTAEARADTEALTTDHIGSNGIHFYLNAGANVLSFNEFADTTNLHVAYHTKDAAGDDVAVDLDLTALAASSAGTSYHRVGSLADFRNITTVNIGDRVIFPAAGNPQLAFETYEAVATGAGARDTLFNQANGVGSGLFSGNGAAFTTFRTATAPTIPVMTANYTTTANQSWIDMYNSVGTFGTPLPNGTFIDCSAGVRTPLFYFDDVQVVVPFLLLSAAPPNNAFWSLWNANADAINNGSPVAGTLFPLLDSNGGTATSGTPNNAVIPDAPLNLADTPVNDGGVSTSVVNWSPNNLRLSNGNPISPAFNTGGFTQVAGPVGHAPDNSATGISTFTYATLPATAVPYTGIYTGFLLSDGNILRPVNASGTAITNNLIPVA